MTLRNLPFGSVGLLGLLVVGFVAGAGCEYRAPELPKLPVRVEVENSPHVEVAVKDGGGL